jgi:Tol biopolymer transport system component
VDIEGPKAVWVYFTVGEVTYVVDAAAAVSQSYPLTETDSVFTDTALSPDGTRVALLAADQKSATIWSFDSGEPTPYSTVTNLAADGAMFFEYTTCENDGPWLPTNDRLLFSALGEGDPWYYRTVDISTNALFTAAGPYYTCSRRFSPDATWVAFGQSANLRAARLSGTAEDIELGVSGSRNIEWSSDGHFLASLTENRELRVHSFAGGGAPTLAWVHEGVVAEEFQWAPRGNQLAIYGTSDFSTFGPTYLVDLDATAPAAQQLTPGNGHPPVWSDSGDFLLVSPLNGTGVVLDVATGLNVTPTALVQGNGQPLRMGVNNRWLLWRQGTGGTALTDLAAGTTTTVPEGGRFSVDGSIFVVRRAVTDPTVLTHDVYDLTGAELALLGSFATPSTDSYLRSAAGAHYVFWVAQYSPTDSRLYVLRIIEGRFLPVRQLSTPGQNVGHCWCSSHNRHVADDVKCVPVVD